MMVWGITGGLLAVGVVAALRVWPYGNAAETGGSPGYPDLQPKTYPMELDRLSDVSRTVADRMPGWSRVTDGFGAHEIHEIRATATSALFRFQDDIMIRVTRQGQGARVWVRSASRIGRWDFGQNARTIRAFLTELDRALPQESAPP